MLLTLLYNTIIEQGKHRLKKQKKANIIPRRRSDDEKENVEEIVDSVADIEKPQESTLGTAALIATVTFTALSPCRGVTRAVMAHRRPALQFLRKAMRSRCSY